ncbi:FAD-dependent oxidoreductase [Rhodobacter capsulatus]|uniref:FAD-dependent oxidoreductase n=1 Tax=Rhodobacter capsulatus TaxID=1061 RepID=UPI0040297127
MEDLQAARRDPAQDTGVLVIGGGIGGLAAADALARAGHRVVLLEAGDWLGGMHHSVEIGPYSFDLGAIFYEETAALFDLAPGLRDLCPQVQRVQCRIDPEGTLCHYPIELRDLRRWPRARLAGAVAAMLAARLLLRRDGTLERACVNRLGPVFYRGTGLRDYVARFNVSPPEAIDEEFFVDRMRFVHRQTDFAAMARAGWNGLRHGAFRVKPRDPLRVRPRAGYGVLFERIRAQLEAAGGRVVLQAPVTRIEREASGRMVVTSPAGRFRAATVVGAAPLDTLHRAVFGTESGFESLSLMTLFVSAGRFAPGAGNLLFNFHGAGRWKRATFYSRIYPDPAIPREYLSVEATLLPGEALSPETVFAEFAAQCLRLGLAEDLRLEGAVTTPQAYPLYRPGQLARRAAVLERLVQAGVLPVGRQGRFEYLPTASGVVRRVQEELTRAGLAHAGRDGQP